MVIRLIVYCALLLCPIAAVGAESNVHLRGDLNNCRIRFERQGKGHVAFMGGSITEMNGYRPMVMANLKKRFPRTKFSFTDAGIASTCSTTGAFRLQRDVLSKGPVDLFFVEFAVNDDQDAAHAERDSIRGMEGIVGQIKEHNPNADIVIVYFVNPGMLKLISEGKTPTSIAAHEKVAKHYILSVIHLAKEVADRIKAKTFTWKQYGGTHPAKAGNAVCAGMIESLFDRAWAKPLAADAKPQRKPWPTVTNDTDEVSPWLLDAHSYVRGRFVDPAKAKIDAHWDWSIPNWKKIPGGFRSRFAKDKVLHAVQPGAALSVPFEGTAIGAYVLAGPDAGVVEVSIDGGEYKAVNLYHRFSRGLHYPRTVMFAAELKSGKHQMVLRIAKSSDARSKGHAVRILQFVAN